MKILTLAGLLAGAMGLLTCGSGCATPAYSPSERNDQIARTWEYEGKMAVEDFDRAMLFYPPTQLTIWNVR
jgi:hypothetical protein